MSAGTRIVAEVLVVGAVAAVLLVPWARRVERRLGALEHRQSAAAATERVADLPFVRDPRRLAVSARKALDAYRAIGMGPRGWNARDRDAFAELAAVLDDARQVDAAEAAGERRAFAWCAAYLDEVRGGRGVAPVDRMLAGIARTFRRRARLP